MPKKAQLLPLVLLVLVLGSFWILRRPASTPPPPAKPEAQAPEKGATKPESSKPDQSFVEAGPRVRGRVLTESRQPIEGARVWIGRGGWALSKPLGVTAKDGSYDLPLPVSDQPNYLQIHVLAEGYRPDTRKFGPLVGDQGPTIILQPSPLVRGIVLERGSWRPLGGVTIQAMREKMEYVPLSELRARDDGSFEFALLPQETVFFCLRGVGFGHDAATAVKADGSFPDRDDLPPEVVKLYPGRAILAVPPMGAAIILVKDEAGKPIVGAEVRHLETVKTDAEGRARLAPLPEGEAGVEVAAENFTPVTQAFQVIAHQDTKVDVVLKKGGARIFGTISVAEGQPEPKSVELWPGVLGSEGAHCRHAEVLSSVAAGRKYSLSVPHGEPVRLVVRFDGDARIPWFDRGSVTLGFGESLERNLVIEPLCRLRIEVKDAKGQPVAGASLNWEGGSLLRIERQHFSGTLTEAEATLFGETLGSRRQGGGVSDKTGTLIACVVKGSYKVDASHGEFKPHKGQSFPVDGDATREIILEKALRVVGRLTTWDGQPANGWHVGLERSGNDGMATTDGDGAFVINSASPGPQKVSVCWPQYYQTVVMTRDVALSEGMGVLELRLPPLPLLRGRLRGFRVQDLGETRFECSAESDQVGYMRVAFSVAPDANGLFTVGPMPAADYWYYLRVQPTGQGPAYVAAGGKLRIDPERETTLDLDCSAPGSISMEIDILETSRYDRYGLILSRPNGGSIDSIYLDVKPRSALKQKMDLIAAPGTYLVEVVGSVNYTEDRKRKVFQGTVTLEPGGKVLLSASSR